MSKVLGAAVAVAVASLALAADYSDDDLCRVIGDSPTVAVPPRDRLFLEKNCVCYGPAGCAAPGSPRDKAIQDRLARALAAEKQRQEAELAAAKQRQVAEEAARKEARKRRVAADAKTEPLRKAYWACAYDQINMDCREQLKALRKACEATGQYKWGEDLDIAACIHQPTAEQVKALEAEAEAKAMKKIEANRAVTDEKLEPQRAVYWACMSDIRKLCVEERMALKRACDALGDLIDHRTFEACEGPKR